MVGHNNLRKNSRLLILLGSLLPGQALAGGSVGFNYGREIARLKAADISFPMSGTFTEYVADYQPHLRYPIKIRAAYSMIGAHEKDSEFNADHAFFYKVIDGDDYIASSRLYPRKAKKKDLLFGIESYYKFSDSAWSLFGTLDYIPKSSFDLDLISRPIEAFEAEPMTLNYEGNGYNLTAGFRYKVLPYMRLTFSFSQKSEKFDLKGTSNSAQEPDILDKVRTVELSSSGFLVGFTFDFGEPKLSKDPASQEKRKPKS